MHLKKILNVALSLMVLISTIPNLAFAETSSFSDLNGIVNATSLSTNSYIVKLKTEEDKIDLENVMLGIENMTGTKKVKEEFENLPYLLLNLTSAEVSNLQDNSVVSFIELDKEVQLSDNEQSVEKVASTSPLHTDSKDFSSKLIEFTKSDLDKADLIDNTVSSVTYNTYSVQPETVDNLVYGTDFFPGDI